MFPRVHESLYNVDVSKECHFVNGSFLIKPFIRLILDGVS